MGLDKKSLLEYLKTLKNYLRKEDFGSVQQKKVSNRKQNEEEVVNKGKICNIQGRNLI
jgi:hypothetical protein